MVKWEMSDEKKGNNDEKKYNNGGAGGDACSFALRLQVGLSGSGSRYLQRSAD